MHRARRLVTALVLLALASPGMPVYGQGGASRSDGWDSLLMPSFWMPVIDGELTIEGLEFQAAAGLGDLVEHFNYAGQLHLEAWRGRWGLYGEPTYGQLSAEGALAVPILGGIDAVARMQQLSGELGGWYRLVGRPPGTGGGPGPVPRCSARCRSMKTAAAGWSRWWEPGSGRARPGASSCC